MSLPEGAGRGHSVGAGCLLPVGYVPWGAGAG